MSAEITGVLAIQIRTIGAIAQLGGHSYSDLKEFTDDIDRLACRDGSWVIPMCFCCGPTTRVHKVHLCYSTVKHDQEYDNKDCTIADVVPFDSFASDLSSVF